METPRRRIYNTACITPEKCATENACCAGETAVETAAGPPVMCKQCGIREVEEARRCYATPVCYTCLPPPPPLPTFTLPAPPPPPSAPCDCGRPMGHPDDWDCYSGPTPPPHARNDFCTCPTCTPSTPQCTCRIWGNPEVRTEDPSCPVHFPRRTPEEPAGGECPTCKGKKRVPLIGSRHQPPPLVPCPTCVGGER